MLLEFISEFIVEFIFAFILSIALSYYYFSSFKYLFILLSLPIITVLFLWFSHATFFNEKFNSKKWKNSPQFREEMSDILIKKRLLIGKSKAEIIGILGSNYETDGVSENTIFYILDGNKYGGDPESLFIRFENNLVIEVGNIIN